MLTPREIVIFSELCKYIDLYHESNPDVGMGPSPKMIVEEAEKVTTISLTDIEKRDLAEIHNQWRKEHGW